MPVATEARRLRRKNPYDAYISYESSSNDPTTRNVKAHLGSGVHPSWKAFFEQGPWFGGSNEVVNPLYLKDPYQSGWNEQYGVNYKLVT
jgi:hypothetical protein